MKAEQTSLQTPEFQSSLRRCFDKVGITVRSDGTHAVYRQSQEKGSISLLHSQVDKECVLERSSRVSLGHLVCPMEIERAPATEEEREAYEERVWIETEDEHEEGEESEDSDSEEES